MTKSLYSKLILGYLLFGLLGFIIIATFSSHVTELYLVEEMANTMYDEANLLASTYSDIYQGKNVSLATAKPQLDAVATYLKTQVWVIDNRGMVIAETTPASHVGMLIDGFD
ncbi:MAG: two-component sensor histidine kinase, partial [Lachnospiraceae bacterium]|nr:two-component sensor histidine kinase [Lachnospiraceae bacterium]